MQKKKSLTLLLEFRLHGFTDAYSLAQGAKKVRCVSYDMKTKIIK